MCLAILSLHYSACSLQGTVEQSDGTVLDFCAALCYECDMKSRENIEYIDDLECDGLDGEELEELRDLLNNEVMRHRDMYHE